ncbi:MAG TPA: LLM class flavin-dependent oxidoreductase, partial [Stellaceae bacterium]|nr:LLM class flavin-dependent oxidoreductase [Stellaceae bacterium]
MDLGYFTMPLHPPSRDYTETLKEDREAILLAEKLGFVEAFVGEHVTDLAESITSSLMFIASLAHDTPRIKLGSGTLNLPNNHPAAVAGQVA